MVCVTYVSEVQWLELLQVIGLPSFSWEKQYICRHSRRYQDERVAVNITQFRHKSWQSTYTYLPFIQHNTYYQWFQAEELSSTCVCTHYYVVGYILQCITYILWVLNLQDRDSWVHMSNAIIGEGSYVAMYVHIVELSPLCMLYPMLPLCRI